MKITVNEAAAKRYTLRWDNGEVDTFMASDDRDAKVRAVKLAKEFNRLMGRGGVQLLRDGKVVAKSAVPAAQGRYSTSYWSKDFKGFESNAQEGKMKITVKESKKQERLADISIEQIVDEAVAEVQKQVEGGTCDPADKDDVSYAIGRALKKSLPDVALNLVEDIAEKLGYLKDDDKYFDMLQDAVTYTVQ